MSFPKFAQADFFSSRAFVFLMIAVHLLIVLPLAYFLNIWMDEASTLHTTQNGFFFAFQHAATDEKQAPFYFWALSLWRGINHSILFARVFSIVFSAAAIKFFFDLSERVFDKNKARLITIFFALHPVLIWASLEIRVYSLVVLLSILLLIFFHKGYFQNESEPVSAAHKARIFYFLTALVALYTNYYLGFILVGNFCGLLITKRFRAALAYFWQMLIVGACALPLLYIAGQQFAANTGGFQEKRTIIEGLRILWGHALTFVLPIGLSPAAEPSIVSNIRIWIARLGILLLVFSIIKNKFRGFDENAVVFSTLAAIVAAFIFAAYFLVGSEYVAMRHAVVLFVPLILTARLLREKFAPRKIGLALAALVIFSFSYSFASQYSSLAKRGDWARVAAFIEAREKPDQPIIIFRNFDALSLPYYYHGANKILPDDNFFAWNNEADLRSENALKTQIDFVISQIPPDASEIWLATEELCQNEKLSACQPLENYVETHYTTLETRDFYKERLRLLRRK